MTSDNNNQSDFCFFMQKVEFVILGQLFSNNYEEKLKFFGIYMKGFLG
jgi:hypothetical protein